MSDLTQSNPFAPPSSPAGDPSLAPAGDVPTPPAVDPSPDPAPQPEPEPTKATLEVGQVVTYRYEDVYAPTGPADVEVLGLVVDVDDTGAARLALLERVTGHIPADELEAR